MARLPEHTLTTARRVIPHGMLLAHALRVDDPSIGDSIISAGGASWW
ncbi:MAG: hypothetical protein HDS75_03240 [Bacteroidales bacterium]|nr:hypothetical protein [Bacteroidales bacterium]